MGYKPRRNPPLLWAAENVDVSGMKLKKLSGNEAVVKLLLDTVMVDVDSKDRDGRTPASYAAQRGHKTVLGMLLNTGKVDIDNDGQTLLHWAAWRGKTVPAEQTPTESSGSAIKSLAACFASMAIRPLREFPTGCIPLSVPGATTGEPGME